MADWALKEKTCLEKVLHRVSTIALRQNFVGLSYATKLGSYEAAYSASETVFYTSSDPFITS